MAEESSAMSPTELADLQAILDTANMSADERKFVLSSIWTQSEIPAIKSLKQYHAYAAWQRSLDSKLARRWFQTRGTLLLQDRLTGVLATSVGARMIEWEEAQPRDAS